MKLLAVTPKWILLAGSILLIIFSSACSQGELNTFSAEPDEAYNALFTRTEGWTGGDGACTIPLSEKVTLWLFGDSWVGPVVDNRHYNATMITNAVAIQYGTKAYRDKLHFYYGESDGKPEALFTPPDGTGFIWPCGGVMVNGEVLYLFMEHVVKLEGDSTVFGFKETGTYIMKVENPMDEPGRWRTGMIRVPHFERTAEGIETSFSAPQFIRDGYVYIYGTRFDPPAFNRYMILARAPEERLLDFDRWEFYAGTSWQPDYLKAAPLCDQFGAEFSVSWQPRLKQFITVYTELGMSDKIMLRTSPRPEGPWSAQRVVYRCPDSQLDKDYFCYAAKGHPELSDRDELLISYVCNSTDFWKMAADTRIYRPKFIRIKL